MKIQRIISLTTLGASAVAVVLVLQKPAPVARPQSAAVMTVNAESFGEKMEQLEKASQQAARVSYPSLPTQSQENRPYDSGLSNVPPKVEIHINSDEVEAALSGAGSGQLAADPNVGSGAPTIKDQQVSFEGDVVRGQFLAVVAGKDVWVTVSGHLSSKDGYAAFDPTEFKLGDLSVPVSLVNPALQKKLAEQRDRLKLPDYVGELRVQNGELVMQQK